MKVRRFIELIGNVIDWSWQNGFCHGNLNKLSVNVEFFSKEENLRSMKSNIQNRYLNKF